MNVSSKVVIMTVEELEKIKQKHFSIGVKRGHFAIRHDLSKLGVSIIGPLECEGGKERPRVRINQRAL